MEGYLLSLATILGAWAFVWAAAGGCGLLLRRLFQVGPLEPLDLIPVFWTGWAAVLALLQIWQLWLPIGALTLASVGLLGLLGLALETRHLLGLAGRALRRAPGPLALLALAIVWAANRSAGPVQFYDIGLYYQQTVLWNTSYAIVPGLANLHARLGFNSSYFLYAALVDVGPFAGMALNSANGALLVGLLAQGLAGAACLLARVGPRRTAFWHTLTLAPTLAYLFGQEGGGPNLPAEIYLNGYSPDVGVFAIGLALSGLLAPLLLEPEALSPARRAHLRFAVALVACAGVAVKLSFAAYGAIAVTVAYGAALAWDRPKGAKEWLALVGPAAACVAVMGGIWAVRGVILSGYPLFPATFGAAPVTWRVPKAIATDHANWIRSWGRRQGPHWSEVLADSAWLQPWLNGLHPLVGRPIGLSIIAGAVALTSLAGLRVAPKSLARAVLFLLPPASSAAFWFFTAPGYRFVGAAFWALGLGLALLATERLRIRLPAPSTAAYLVATLLVLLYTAPVRTPLLLAGDPTMPGGIAQAPEATLTAEQTASGLVLNVPVDDDRCWAAPLPCTPFFDGRLRLIRPGDPGSGFVADPPRRDVDLLAEPPAGVRAPDDLGVTLLAGWHAYEPDSGLRWMADEGVLLLFSEQPRQVMLTLVPASIREGEGFGDRGRLLVDVGRHADSAELTAGAPATVTIPLGRGFTRVELRLEAGSLTPTEVFPDSTDTRPLSIAVSEIAFDE